jgi:hypothetical protein
MYADSFDYLIRPQQQRAAHVFTNSSVILPSSFGMTR